MATTISVSLEEPATFDAEGFEALEYVEIGGLIAGERTEESEE